MDMNMIMQQQQQHCYYPVSMVGDVYKNGNGNGHNNNNNNRISWIDLLLTIPLKDNRKYCIWRIFAPYFINKIGLSFDEAFAIIDVWTAKCAEVEPLKFNKE